METCLLNGKIICALDIRNKYNIEDHELKRKWKTAQYNNELICDDCGTPMELRAGDVKIPHFAHKRGFQDRDCYYDDIKETEEHRKAKSILYNYFMDKYPYALVQPNKKQPNNRRTDIYVEQGKSKLAVEYQRSGLRVVDWDKRHEDYEKLDISDLWILSSRIYNERMNDFDFLTQVLLHETRDKTAKFMDVDSEKIKLLRKIDYADKNGIIKKRKFFSRTYDLNDIIITLDGKIESDFDQQYETEKEEFIKDCQKEEAQVLSKSDQEKKLDMILQRQRDWFNSKKKNNKKSPAFAPNEDLIQEIRMPVEKTDLTLPEQELEAMFVLNKDRNLEIRDQKQIQEWIDQFNRLMKDSEKHKANYQYTRLKVWCERIFQGYRNNGYISLQNTERLKLKLKLLGDMVSGVGEGE